MQQKLWLQESHLEVHLDRANLKVVDFFGLGGHLRWMSDCIKIRGCWICASRAGRCSSQVSLCGLSMVSRKLRFLPSKTTFRLGDPLGMGRVGVVYRAESPDLDEPVAVKLLHPSVSGDAKIVERFEREVHIVERLNHPNIVKHYGGGILDGQYYYAMQLLDDGTLKDYLVQQGRLPWKQVVVLSAQIAGALQHAHNHGIIHRDLKPSNLFFAKDGSLVLGDFGIAFDLDDSDITDQGMTVGTYAYMPPEQIRADSKVSNQSDLYSLGCVMYEMLAGRRPFAGANFAQIWDQHLHAEPLGLRVEGVECPEWLEDLILSMLSKNSGDRPFSARAVQGTLRQHMWDEFGGTTQDIIAQSLPARVPSQPSQTNPRMWVLWCVLAVVVMGVTWACLQQL